MCQQDTTFEMFGLCDVRIRAVARRLSESGRYSIGIWHTIIISWHQDNAAWRSPSRHYYTTNFRFLSKFSLLFLNFIITTNTLGFLLATKLILHIPRRSSSSLLDGLYFIWLNCYISSISDESCLRWTGSHFFVFDFGDVCIYPGGLLY
jgi:hypothetical protein